MPTDSGVTDLGITDFGMTGGAATDKTVPAGRRASGAPTGRESRPGAGRPLLEKSR